MTLTKSQPQNDASAAQPSAALAAYLFANDFSLFELLENYPALEIGDLLPSLRLARGLAAEYGDDDRR